MLGREDTVGKNQVILFVGGEVRNDGAGRGRDDKARDARK